MTDRLFKFLKADGSPTHGPSSFRWPMPQNGTPGEWVSVQGDLVPCQNGLHLVRASGLLEWASAKLCTAEHEGECVEKDANVLVCRKARLIAYIDTWNDRNLRLFACDCAERVLPIFEKYYPDDKRTRQAIETARRYANGEATQKELAAARAAAGAAVWAAAWAAAGDAAGDAARAAAGDAAGAAAWDAASPEAWDAAVATERAWQQQRLMQYLELKS